MSGYGGTLESLHGVNQYLLDKAGRSRHTVCIRPCDKDSIRASRRLLFKL